MATDTRWDSHTIEELTHAMAELYGARVSVCYGRRQPGVRSDWSSMDAALVRTTMPGILRGDASGCEHRNGEETAQSSLKGGRVFLDDTGVRRGRIRRIIKCSLPSGSTIEPLAALQQCDAVRKKPACVVCYCDASESASLSRVRELAVEDPPPIVLLVGNPTTRDVVQGVVLRVFAAGEETCSDDELGRTLRDALWHDQSRRQLVRFEAECRQQYQSLTEGELAIVTEILNGRLNKNIAAHVGVSVRTVENRRARAFKKFGVNSISALIQRVLIAQGRLEAALPS